MSDARLRELERRWRESGSVEDEEAWLIARCRAGEILRWADYVRLAELNGTDALDYMRVQVENGLITEDQRELTAWCVDVRNCGAGLMALPLSVPGTTMAQRIIVGLGTWSCFETFFGQPVGMNHFETQIVLAKALATSACEMPKKPLGTRVPLGPQGNPEAHLWNFVCGEGEYRTSLQRLLAIICLHADESNVRRGLIDTIGECALKPDQLVTRFLDRAV